MSQRSVDDETAEFDKVDRVRTNSLFLTVGAVNTFAPSAFRNTIYSV